MRILVTGSAGFIGRHLVKELHEAGHDGTEVDIRYGVDGFFRRRLQKDLRDPWATSQAFDIAEPDVCIHLAAKVGRLFGEDDLNATITDNAVMTAHVAQECGRHGVRLVYASTSEVYGDNGNDLCDEIEGPFALPHNLYGLSKRWGEEVCRLYAPENLTVWRVSMPYGPGLPAGRGRAAIINMLHQAHHNEPIPVHRGAERSWCWIGDTVRAMRMTIENTDGGVFNIGRDDNPTKMTQVARMACDIAGADYGLIAEVDPPERQTVVKRLATSRIRDLGWEPRVELFEGMVRTYVKMNLAVAA